MRERQRDYELLFIVSPLRATDEDVAATIGRVGQTIASLGGQVTATTHTPPWGRRKFAYPIREYAEGEASRRMFTEGYYVLLHFRLPAQQITELERTLKLSDAILRYLLTLVDPRDVAPAAAVPAGAAERVDDDASEGDNDEE